MNLNRFLTVPLARPLPLLAASFTLAACSGGDSTGPGRGTPPPPAAITSVSIGPEASSLFTGLSVVLVATAHDASGNTVPSATFAWTSSDATIATVDENGVVSGISAGEATITATSGGHSAAAPVRVNPSLSENVQVSTESAIRPHQEEPHIVVDAQGRLFAGWKDIDFAGGVWLVGFARSDDGGRSWFEGGSMDLRFPTRFQGDPWLAVDELGRVYYSRVETDLNLGGGDEIIVSRSDDPV